MEPRIKKRFTEALLNKILTRYNIAPQDITALDGFESFIYEVQQKDTPYILRIGHSNRRPANLVQAEADWINYLVAGGVSAARALPSAQGNLIETIDDAEGEQFVAVAFQKAPGQPPHKIGWNEEREIAYGSLIGHIHALTKNYTPTTPGCRRQEWNAGIADTTLASLPAEEKDIAARYQAALDEANALPKTQQNYGLIHFDAHGGNFFMTEDNILTLFDFDDSAYSWYANDIAMVLFYWITNWPDKPARTAEFLPRFLRGYRQHAPVPAESLSHLPLFMKLREIDLYAVILRDFTTEQISGDGWLGTFMKNRRQLIIDNVPYVDFDWSSLA